MYYIKLDESMNLIATVIEPIYRGDHMNQKITYLIPLEVGDIDMLTAVVYLNFIRADGEADIVMLNRLEEKYKEAYYQYTLPVTCKLSKYAGEVLTWMQIYSGSASDPTVAKSGENVIRVYESKNMDDYIGDWRSDKVLTALYQMKKQTDEEFATANENIGQNAQAIESNADAIRQNAEAITQNAEAIGQNSDAIRSNIAAITAHGEAIAQLQTLVAVKADNLVFDEADSSIRLLSGGVPVGDKVVISSVTGKSISSVSMTTNGELVVFFNDETFTNVGKVVGDDGKVYVPHIDAHKVLTFTIEDKSGELPDPVDLNPQDDWSGIDDSGVETDYVWEPMDGESGSGGSDPSNPSWDDNMGG